MSRKRGKNQKRNKVRQYIPKIISVTNLRQPVSLDYEWRSEKTKTIYTDSCLCVGVKNLKNSKKRLMINGFRPLTLQCNK